MDTSQIIGVSVLVVTIPLLVIWWYLRHTRAREADQLLTTTAQALGLTKSRTRSVPWALDSFEIGAGMRDGLRVTVRFTHVGDEIEEPMTMVEVEWKRPLTAGITLDRFTTDHYEGRKDHAAKSKSWIHGPGQQPVYRPTYDLWFTGWSIAGQAPDAELERVFNPKVRAMLDGFPRRFAVVAVADRTLYLQWYGLERDVAMVERVFRLGIDWATSIETQR